MNPLKHIFVLILLLLAGLQAEGAYDAGGKTAGDSKYCLLNDSFIHPALELDLFGYFRSNLELQELRDTTSQYISPCGQILEEEVFASPPGSLPPKVLCMLAEDLAKFPELRKLFDSAENVGGRFVKAWEVVISSPLVRVSIDKLQYVSNYLSKFPNYANDVKVAFENLVDVRRVAFVKGLKNAAKHPLQITNPAKLRQANPGEIKNSVNRFADHRLSVGGGGNYGYLEGTVNGNVVDDKMWRSISEIDAQNEIHIFSAISAQGSNGSEWLRITDSEYRMLNKLAQDLGGQAGQSYPSITGTLKIASENPYCPSCQGVIQQFHDMFPNLNLILVDGIK